MTSLLLAITLLFQAPVIRGNGTVAGRVLSIDGTPAPGVRVTAMMPREPGQAEGVSIYTTIAQTDTAGRYRLENVPAGRYYITAGLIDAPTYYPGVSALSAATVVVIADGATKDGVDFQLKVPPGMKVSGRLAVLPTPRAAPATIVLGGGTTFTVQETNVNPDGTFEFQRVTPGSYTLTNFFGLPNLPVMVTDHDVTGLEVGRGAQGVRVSGRLVSPDSSPGTFASLPILLSGTFTASAATAAGGGAGIIAASGTTASFQARPDSTGAFEFLKVPPGSYMIRVPAPGATQSLSLVVADKEITNLEVSVPFQQNVSGRIVLEDGRPWAPAPGTTIEARRANSTIGTGIQAGSFTLRLAEGEYQIGLRGLPLGYVLKGISAGDTPLAGALKIAPGSPAPANVVITVASIPLESIQGVKVSGRITGVPPGMLAGTSVILTGSDAGLNTIETSPSADGTFEFPKVPTGNYNARVNGLANASINPLATRFFVGTDNITGIQIPVEVRTVVTGRVTVVDANGTVVPGFPAGVTVMFRRANSSSGTSIRPDGTFTIALLEGENVLNFERLPAGYTVKSAVWGSTDLLNNPLKVDKSQPPPLIEVRMEMKP